MVAIPIGVAVRIWIRIVAAAIIEATAERDWKQEPDASHQPRMSRDAAVVQVSLTTALRFDPAPAAEALGMEKRKPLEPSLRENMAGFYAAEPQGK